MIRAPETAIAIFGFLTAFVWEMWQMPLFDISSLSWMKMVRGCTLASFGDAGIMTAAFVVAARVSGTRDWHRKPRLSAVLAYLTVGLVATVAIERWATGSHWGWRYADAMPLDPVLGIGLVPLAMWIVVPLVALELLRWSRL